MVLDAHQAIIDLSATLGYPKNATGCCHGVVLKWLEASLLGEEERQRFIKRIEKIRSIDPEELLVQINGVKDKVKMHEELTKEDEFLLEIPAFYEGLELYFNPDPYASLFEQQLEQVNIDEISQFAASKKIEDLGGLKTLHYDPCIYTNAELAAYLKNLMGIIEANKQSVGIHLGSHSHAIGLHYNVETHSWTFMDINQWRPIVSNNTKRIAQKIIDGFIDKETPYCAFSTRIILPSTLNTPKLESDLEDFRKEHIDSITPETAMRQGDVNLLYIAVREGDSTLVKTLCNALLENGRGADLSFKYTSKENTLLSLAADDGNDTVVEELCNALISCNRGDDLNTLNRFGRSPLNIAIKNGHLAAVRTLLAYGADMNIVNPDGLTPLSYARKLNNPAIINALLEHNGTLKLIKAAEQGRLEEVNALLAQGININESDSSGDTALMKAAKNAHLEVVKTLINHGADINISNHVSPLNYNAAACALSEWHNAENIFINNPEGRDRTGLDTYKEIYRLLFKNINYRSFSGNTQLTKAIANRELDAVHALIDQGADISIPNDRGIKPIELAKNIGHLDMVKLLVKGAVSQIGEKGRIDELKSLLQYKEMWPATLAVNTLELQQFINQHYSVAIPESMKLVLKGIHEANPSDKTISMTPDEFEAIMSNTNNPAVIAAIKELEVKKSALKRQFQDAPDKLVKYLDKIDQDIQQLRQNPSSDMDTTINILRGDRTRSKMDKSTYYTEVIRPINTFLYRSHKLMNTSNASADIRFVVQELQKKSVEIYKKYGSHAKNFNKKDAKWIDYIHMTIVLLQQNPNQNADQILQILRGGRNWVELKRSTFYQEILKPLEGALKDPARREESLPQTSASPSTAELQANIKSTLTGINSGKSVEDEPKPTRPRM